MKLHVAETVYSRPDRPRYVQVSTYKDGTEYYRYNPDRLYVDEGLVKREVLGTDKTAAFAQAIEYNRLIDEFVVGEDLKRGKSSETFNQTVGSLVDEYLVSPHYLDLTKNTQKSYKYCIDVDKDSPPCNMFNGEEINRCPDSCELHVVGGNKAICREPNLGRLSCAEYNYLDKEDCPVGVNDACQLDGDICRSKPGLAGCGDRLTYNDCVNDDNCYVKPERGGFKCKTVPEDESDSNWDEYIKSRGNNNVTTPSDDESLDSGLLLTNQLLRNTRDNKNRNLAVHSLIRNYYQKMRKITDDISNDLPY